MSFNPMANINKLTALMKSYIDEENYNYALFYEVISKMELADAIIMIIKAFSNKENKDE